MGAATTSWRHARTNARPVIWLDHPVPLDTNGRSKVLVSGVSWDAPKGLRSYWLQLGRAANTNGRTERDDR